MMALLAALVSLSHSTYARPAYAEQLIFPLNPLHNHASCIVECPNGDLLACWYRGTGERTADDVAIMGSRLRRNAEQWIAPFLMADTPGFPDCNPCMLVDPRARLRLFWPVIIDNNWESALLLQRVSTDYQRHAGAPRWTDSGVVLLKPGKEFAARVEAELDRQWSRLASSLSPEERARLNEYVKERRAAAGNKLSTRLGWMPRPHPVALPSGRILLPLYSDLFDFSLIAYSDDDGATWQASEPIVGPGNVQPSLALCKEGNLVAYFRDNGPAPKRVMVSESRDEGMTWTSPVDTDLPDPGAGVEVIVLRSGRWVLVNNDTEQGRHSLALSISEDEGRTWTRKYRLQHDTPGSGAGSYSYPSIIQARDGRLHVTYSYTPNEMDRARLGGTGQSIKHVSFTEEWMLANAVPMQAKGR
jgi:predicted neuraminidase